MFILDILTGKCNLHAIKYIQQNIIAIFSMPITPGWVFFWNIFQQKMFIYPYCQLYPSKRKGSLLTIFFSLIFCKTWNGLNLLRFSCMRKLVFALFEATFISKCKLFIRKSVLKMKTCWNPNESITWISSLLLFKFSIHNSFFNHYIFSQLHKFHEIRGKQCRMCETWCFKETDLDSSDVRSLE